MDDFDEWLEKIGAERITNPYGYLVPIPPIAAGLNKQVISKDGKLWFSRQELQNMHFQRSLVEKGVYKEDLTAVPKYVLPRGQRDEEPNNALGETRGDTLHGTDIGTSKGSHGDDDDGLAQWEDG